MRVMKVLSKAILNIKLSYHCMLEPVAYHESQMLILRQCRYKYV